MESVAARKANRPTHAPPKAPEPTPRTPEPVSEPTPIAAQTSTAPDALPEPPLARAARTPARARHGAGKPGTSRPKAAAKRAAKPPAVAAVRHEQHSPVTVGAGSGGGGRPAEPPVAEAEPEAEAEKGSGGSELTPAQAFDALYAFSAPGLVRQTYLLTGRRALAKEAVERAFHQAWERWPEVAVDRDPVGWVRAAAYEYALSPWHRLRRSHRHPDAPPAEPEDRKLLDTLLSLPASYRRTLVLYDGVGLDLPETAAETEASTPAAAHRLLHAREAVAEQLPELAEPGQLQRRLDELARAEKLSSAQATVVRTGSENRSRFWTRAAIAFTALIIGASALALATSETHYEPKTAPGETVRGVPPRMGPGKLSPHEKQLRKKLREEPASGPERIHPLAE
ncbi:sigma-70 family RNA polymerase sigma factor [Streptomyces sp. NBC_01304]|nr:sigma-70 family RNA polymerase sigma factor [Streptomyces sp. NBC_01304]